MSSSKLVVASLSCAELGTAQPQLVFIYHTIMSNDKQIFNDQKDTISQHLKRATLSLCMLTIHNCIMEPITAKPSWPPETWVVLANIWPCPSVILVQITQLLNNSDTSPSHIADISSQPCCLKKHYAGSSCFPLQKCGIRELKQCILIQLSACIRSRLNSN